MLAFILTVSLGALDAPISHVTVFTDQARVTRTSRLSIEGSQAVEFPPLREEVDPSSIQVEAVGAELRYVELKPMEPRGAAVDAPSVELDRVQREISRLTAEQGALTLRVASLTALKPTEPPADRRLSAAGWRTAMSFVADTLAQTQKRLRETERALVEAGRQQVELIRVNKKAKSAEPSSGRRVVAHLVGKGPVTLTLTYVTPRAQWLPTWDLHLEPETNFVTLSLTGLVSQQTGEAWTSARLILSTAVPFKALAMPKLTSWKLGATERFIPEVRRPPTIGDSMVMGSVTDLETGRRLPDVVVSASSSALSGEEVVVSDDSGTYRITPLPAGNYTLKFEKEGYEALNKPQVVPRGQHSLRLNAHLTPALDQTVGTVVSGESHAESQFVRPKADGVRSFESLAFTQTTVTGGPSDAPMPQTLFSLSPPPAWAAPLYRSDTAMTFAGGYDLAFHSVRKETVSSGESARRVALWSQRWPVRVERHLYPALSDYAYLVAELKNPSTQVLPGGPAQLSVGADPAGTASMKVVSPGEAFTFPLGIDPAIRPIRNIVVIDTTRGFLSKDDLSTYTVIIEVVNPHPAPIAVRVYDQWPLSESDKTHTELIESKPLAIADSKNGGLEWRLTIAPQQKQLISFRYSIKRPQGWKLEQAL